MILSRVVLELLEKKSRENGMSIDEYLLEVLTSDLNPRDRADKYIEASLDLLEQAKKELDKGDLRQASEKIWGAVALSIKAHAYVKASRRLSSHRELREYKDKIADELGDWVIVVFQQADSMHINFYEGWATRKEIEKALKEAEKLVKAIAKQLEK